MYGLGVLAGANIEVEVLMVGGMEVLEEFAVGEYLRREV
jgi:hypothetical protein